MPSNQKSSNKRDMSKSIFDPNVRNSRLPRPGARGPRSYPDQVKNTSSVAPAPVEDRSKFTQELIAANQCLDGEHLPVEDDFLRTEITKLAAEELALDKDCHIGARTVLSGKSDLMKAVISAMQTEKQNGKQEALTLRSVSYGQLLKKRDPDLSLREEGKQDKTYVPDVEFEMYDVKELNASGKEVFKTYCQAPESLGGWHAEVVLPRWHRFRIEYLFDVKLSSETYAALKITCNQRPKDHIYNSATEKWKEQCVKLQTGDFDLDEKFAPGDDKLDTLYLKNTNDLCFSPDVWKEDEEKEMMGDDDEKETFTMSRMTFENRDGKLCILDKVDDDGEHFKSIANFEIISMPSMYIFDDSEMLPLYELVCVRHMENCEDGIEITIGPNDSTRNPDLDGCKRLVVHALVNLNAVNLAKDVREQFASSCGQLLTTGMSADMLVEYVFQQQEKMRPANHHMVQKWGLQDDGWWVLDNCAFKDGEITAVSDSKHSVYHKYFTHNAWVQMRVEDFPRIPICPILHVRYIIGCLMWNHLMPPFFANNEQAAKATFCAGMLGMHAKDLWDASGFAKGMPTLWCVSREMGTGKTSALNLAQHALGIGHRALWAGDATKAATFDAAVMDSGFTRFIDDVVTFVGAQGAQSPIHAEIVRAFFDGTGRQVVGKPQRQPGSAVAYSSNAKINLNDAPFQSRLLTIEFKPLDSDGVEWHGFTESDFATCQGLMGAIMPDLEMIGKWNGKLDIEAIEHLALWLSGVVKIKRHRPSNNMAKLAFIELNTIRCFGGGAEQTRQFLHYFVSDVVRTGVELAKHPGIVDQFLLAINEIKETIRNNVLGPNPDRILYLHNFRTEWVPAQQAFFGAVGFWAIKVGPVANVIKNLLGQPFNETELFTALDSHTCAKRSRADFYDLANGWPLKKTISPEGSGAVMDVPIKESELMEDTLTRSSCMLVPKTYIETLTSGMMEVPEYKTVTIDPSGKDAYNLYDQVVDGSWFGYRTLDQTTFGRFCGFGNKIYCGQHNDRLLISTDIERETRDAGFLSVMDCFRPDFIKSMLNFESYNPSNYPPCWLKMPFEARDGDDDLKIPDPFPGDDPEERVDFYDPDEENEDPAPNTKSMKRKRASPTNLSRYPRPPDQVRSLADAVAMGRYLRAGGPAVETDELEWSLDELKNLAEELDDDGPIYPSPLPDPFADEEHLPVRFQSDCVIF